MESHTVRANRSDAGWRGVCDHAQPPRPAHTGSGVARDAADTNANQSPLATESTTFARERSLLSTTTTSARNGRAAAHYPQSTKRGDDLGGALTRQAQWATAVVAAGTTATRPLSLSAASVRHPAVSISSQARQSCSSFFATLSSAAASCPSSMEGFSAPHPVLRSHMVSPQLQPLHCFGIRPNGDDSPARSCFFDVRRSSAELRQKYSQLMPSKSAAAPSPGSVASVPSRKGIVMSPTKSPPVAATPLMRGGSDKALYARPRPASFTYASLSNSGLAEPRQESAQVEAVANDASPRSRQTDMADSSTVRDLEPLSQSSRRCSSWVPPVKYPSTMHGPEQAGVGDARVEAAQRIRSFSASLVSHRQPQQALGGPPPQAGQTHPQGTCADAANVATPGCDFDVLGVGDGGGSSGLFCGEGQTSDEGEVGIPFTPQAAAGAAGIEIGPAAGEWNLPRIQQRILAARLQAQERQHFTSAVEILVSVQMSLDADYREASQGGGELISGFSLTPAQRAHYADLVGRELQYVAALWMKKLHSAESPMLVPTTEVVHAPQGAAESIAVSCAMPPDTTTRTGAEGEDGNRVRVSNSGSSRSSSSSKPCVTMCRKSSEYSFLYSAHTVNSAAASTPQPDSPMPAHATVAVNFASTVHHSPTNAPAKMTQAACEEARMAQVCSPHSPQSRANATNDFIPDGSEASHLSSVLSTAEKRNMWGSYAHTSASGDRSMSAPGVHGNDHWAREVSALVDLHGTSEPGEYCEQLAPCHPRHGREPIRRMQYSMEALSTDSSITTELSSVYDDKVLGPQGQTPFDNTVMARRQHRSTHVKKRSADALLAAIHARSSADTSSLCHITETSNGFSTRNRSSPVSGTSPALGSVRRDSIRRDSPHVQQLSPPQVLMPSAQQHIGPDAVMAAVEAGGESEPATTFDKAADAISSASLHVRSSRAISLAVSPAAPCRSFQQTPERRCLASSAETDVDVAAPPARLHTRPGESAASSLPPPTPASRDACAGDTARTASPLSTRATTGKATLKSPPAAAGDASAAPASSVSPSTCSLCREGGEQQGEASLSDTGSAVKRCSTVLQDVTVTQKQRQSCGWQSVTKAPCDLRQLTETNISSEHRSPRHLSSGGEDVTATSAAHTASTTAAATASITAAAPGCVPAQEERVWHMLASGHVSRQHSASSFSSPRPQAAPATAPPRSSPASPTASSAGIHDGHVKYTCPEATAAPESDSCHHPHRYHEIQPRQKAVPKGGACHQASLRSLSAPSTRPLHAAHDEKSGDCPHSSCTRLSHPYNYEYKTIVCSDGQLHKRLILCKSACPSLRTQISPAPTGFAVPSSAAQHKASEPLTQRPPSLKLSLSPTYPQHPATALVQLADSETTSLGRRASPQRDEWSDAHQAAEAQEPHSAQVVTGTSLAEEQHEAHLLQRVPCTQPEACLVDDSRASAEMPNTPFEGADVCEVVLTASAESGPALRAELTDAPINAAAVDGENEANATAADGAPSSRSADLGGHRACGGRHPFIFSGDVIQWWLDEKGALSGRYYNPYRVKLPRADATALKWGGTPACHMLGVAVDRDDGSNLRHAALDDDSGSSAAPATFKAAAGRNVAVLTYSSAQSACTRQADVHRSPPREWLKTRREMQQHQQPLQSEMHRQTSFCLPTSHGARAAAAAKESRGPSLSAEANCARCCLHDSAVETEMVIGGGARARWAATRPSAPSKPVALPRHLQLCFDDDFNMFRRAAAAAVAAAASGGVAAGAAPQKRPGTVGAKRTYPCKSNAEQ
ncbi:hypothetical protein LSCM1_04120 [Leishmania martiniquensis]|uniref:Uncharacterized protein n=1 Tax=Leishmania martiniquensis TaxID=1580590 RepID=A0A836GJU8_9TRYP|nr:hypothetical protein LSCM1_04120 [Leishmania martiniquensis]